MHPSPIILARCITSKYSAMPAKKLKYDGSATISNKASNQERCAIQILFELAAFFTTHLGSIAHIFYSLTNYTKLATNQRLITYNTK
jgi:hypothetical protein